jgi:hypothetical protein
VAWPLSTKGAASTSHIQFMNLLLPRSPSSPSSLHLFLFFDLLQNASVMSYSSGTVSNLQVESTSAVPVGLRSLLGLDAMTELAFVRH